MANPLQRLARSKAARTIQRTPLAVLAVFPFRIAQVARSNSRVEAAGIRWLFTSREDTNYTYNLSAHDRAHLAWFVAGVAGAGVDEVRGYIEEIVEDADLARHISSAIRASFLRWTADSTARYGRRIGWYALVRAMKPRHVVETGTDKGLGALVIAAALMKNGVGRLTTIDINPASGYLIPGPYEKVIDRVISDSLLAINDLDKNVDLFIHDSDHSAVYEAKEFEAISPKLTRNALVLSDNSHSSWSLEEWAEKTGRRFSFFDERPESHWYRGAGIGASFRAR